MAQAIMTLDQLKKVRESWDANCTCTTCGYCPKFYEVHERILRFVLIPANHEPDGGFKVPCVNPELTPAQRAGHTGATMRDFEE